MLTRHRRRDMAVYGVAVAVLAALYLGAEHTVRKAVYPRLDDQVRSRAMQTVVESLPSFLRLPVERHLRVNRLRAQLDAAATPDAYFKIVYDLAHELGEDEGGRLYTAAMRRYPTAPQGLTAMTALAAAGTTCPLTNFASYADHGDAAFQRQAWSRLWGMLAQAPDPVRAECLALLTQRGIVAPGLESAYAEIERQCVKANRMSEADQAVARQKACREQPVTP